MFIFGRLPGGSGGAGCYLSFHLANSCGRAGWFFLGLGAAARVGIYDYLGYYDVCFIGDEVKDPGRAIPRSIIISLIAVGAIYLTMNLAIIGVVPWRDFVPAAGQPLPDPPPPIA